VRIRFYFATLHVLLQAGGACCLLQSGLVRLQLAHSDLVNRVKLWSFELRRCAPTSDRARMPSVMSRWEQHPTERPVGTYFANANTSSSSANFLHNQPGINEAAQSIQDAPRNPNPKPLAAQTPEQVTCRSVMCLYSRVLP
jgi:hypothetical protein